jgi:chloride channel protein, CIC family
MDAVIEQKSISSRHVVELGTNLISAIVIGSISGLACVGVRLTFRLLQWVFVRHAGMLPAAAATLSPGRRMMTPILGAVCATSVLWVVRRWPRADDYEEYVAAVRFEGGRISFSSTLWRSIASAFSVATGAAIGREGTMIQFAAAVSSWLGRHSPVKTVSLAQQVGYGAAAAVAAAYQAPFAGVFFATEIVLGSWEWSGLPYLAMASTAGWLVSRALLGGAPMFGVSGVLSFSWQILWALPLAMLLGVVAPLYQALLRSLRFASLWPLALVWGGAAVGVLSLADTAVWGNGDVALLRMLTNSSSLAGIATILGLRLVATTFCVGTGTVGGVFTPTLFAGAAIGLVAGHLLSLAQPVLLAVVGLSALLAAVTHAPIMAAAMASELTGQWHLLPLLLLLNFAAGSIARAISPHSLYAIATPTSIEEESVC